MKLLTKQILAKLPKLYETELVPHPDKVAITKLFHPASHWTWYIIEFDGEDICWGLVSGHETEFGYFSLKELDRFRDQFGLSVERDQSFKPKRLKDFVDYKDGGLVVK